MDLMRRIISEFKFWEECRGYGLGIWQCPKFLFIVMGLVTIVAMVATYLVSVKYADPIFTVSGVVIVTIIIFTIGNIIVQSFERAASANRIKTEFVSIASHQLRTPLSSIKWSLDLLLSKRIGELKGKQLEYLETIRASNERMINLVNDLLSVTRIEQGRMTIKKERFSFGEVAEGIMSEASNFAEASNVTLKLVNNVEELKILADKQYISVVLGNLVDNAIRYIHSRGEVVITISRRGSFARAEVKDNGVGIPKSEQRHIFQKFFRSQNIMRHRTEGSGLGLYIARAFVALHGGKMGFSSREGRGTIFWFEIPLK